MIVEVQPPRRRRPRRRGGLALAALIALIAGLLVLIYQPWS